MEMKIFDSPNYSIESIEILINEHNIFFLQNKVILKCFQHCFDDIVSRSVYIKYPNSNDTFLLIIINVKKLIVFKCQITSSFIFSIQEKINIDILSISTVKIITDILPQDEINSDILFILRLDDKKIDFYNNGDIKMFL